MGMLRNEIEKILQELLEGIKVDEFLIKFIETTRATEHTIRENYQLLSSFGIDKNKIAKYAALLSLDSSLIIENYKILKEHDVSDKVIAKYPQLLALNPKTIQTKYERLKELGISEEMISKCPQLLIRDPKTIQTKYERLKEFGISEEMISKCPQLLIRDIETIQTKYEILREFGISYEIISKHPKLLTNDLTTIRRNIDDLEELGISYEKIKYDPQLLTRSLKTIKRNYEILRKLNISNKRIRSCPQLLRRNPKTIKRKYEIFVGLLREPLNQIYPNIDNSYKKEKIEELMRSDKYRNSGRWILINMPQLLGASQETIEGNIQFLYSLEIDYNKCPILLSIKPNKKREKVAWILRELFDYDNEENLENKRNVINRLYEFLRDNPQTLSYSISKLKEKKNDLKYIARKYK